MNRRERIENAVGVLKSEDSKEIFKSLAEKYTDYSVFWDLSENEATLENDNTIITIFSNGK